MTRSLLLAFGAAFGPFIQFLATPLLARTYPPAEFGLLALFLSVAGVMVAISCLRYESVIVVVDDDQLHAAVWVAMVSALLLSVVLLLLVYFGAFQQMLGQLEALGCELWGIPIFSLCGGLLLVGMQLTLRRGDFGLNAVFRSGQTIAFVALALLWMNIGLVKASVLSGMILALPVLAYIAKTTPAASMSKLRALAYERSNHPLLLMPTSLLDALALAAPVLFIGNAYGAESTGNYSQIQRLVGAPLVLLGLVVGQLFLKRSAEIYRGGESSRPLLWKSIGVLTIPAAALILFLAVAGEYVLIWLLGSGWRTDTLFILLVTVPLLCRLIVSPVSSVFITHGSIGVGVKWQIGYFFSTVCLLYWASANLRLEGLLFLYACHEAVVYCIYLYMADRVAQKVRSDMPKAAA